MHWDSDVYLSKKTNWITPSINIMQNNDKFLIANPSWTDNTKEIKEQSCDENNDFYIGYGFSDQVFLAKSKELKKPIYKYSHIYSLRYPMSNLGRIFEMRIDSYMRNAKLLRLTYKNAIYTHPPINEVSSYPKGSFFQAHITRRIYKRVARLYKKLFGQCGEINETNSTK